MKVPGTIEYLHLRQGSNPPPLEKSPAKFVVIIEDVVADEWRHTISDWIVSSGCLYMMAWGNDCSKWDDSIDYANLSQHDFGDIPEENFIMTTWHENEPLSEVFWFTKLCAMIRP